MQILKSEEISLNRLSKSFNSFLERSGVNGVILKKLELQGFKSFANKTVIEFHDGITSVVGPNGSGKSNISDSIRWVLGEQSVKSLRGGKMEDVIFAGTELRKSLGYAEVSLTIQNEQKMLPVDFSEVTITRRVYRSGEGEYFINKVPCRLKDIHELFMDTGIGRDGYSVIGQGRIDEILSTKSEERRSIFEEASGIMKYKTRKIEATRKLDATETNLERVSDILQELENQLGPLEKQATAAKEVLQLRENLKKIEVSAFVENITRIREKATEVEALLSSVQSDINDQNKMLLETQEQNNEIVQGFKVLEASIENQTKRYYEVEGERQNSISSKSLFEEKLTYLQKEFQRLSSELALQSEKEHVLDQELLQKQERMESISTEIQQEQSELQTLKDEAQQTNKVQEAEQREIEVLQNELMVKLKAQTDVSVKNSELSSRLVGIQEQKQNLQNEITLQKMEIFTQNEHKQEGERNLKKNEEDLAEKFKQKTKLISEKNDLSQKLKTYQKNQAEINHQLQVKSTRHGMLKNMEAKMEGVRNSTREIMKECERNTHFSPGIVGPLFKLIQVTEKHATAIELALGGALQNVVTQDEESAKKAIEFLKKGRFGRATFLPLSSIRGKRLDATTIQKCTQNKGFVGLASELVNYEERIENIVLQFLGKVVVVETIDDAIRMARDFKYQFKIVTLQGEVFNPGGSLSGGSQDAKDTGILNRSAEILSLLQEIQKLEQEKERMHERISTVTHMHEEVEEELSQVERVLRDLEHMRIKEESRFLQVQENIQKLEQKLSIRIQESENFVKVVQNLENQMHAMRDEGNRLEAAIHTLQETMQTKKVHFEKEQEKRERYIESITRHQVRIGTLKETYENEGILIRKLLLEYEELKSGVLTRKTDMQNATIEQERINKRLAEEVIRCERLQNLKNNLQSILEEQDKQKKELEKSGEDIVGKLREMNQAVRLLTEEESRLAIQKAKLDSEFEQVSNRLWDEYELTYHNALPQKEAIFNLQAAQKDISNLKNQIKNIGPVYFGAIEEFSKAKERFEFLGAQKKDLDAAKSKLKALIAEMEQTMRKQFIEQFHLINQNFGKVFKELFSGGQARLVLLDEKNVLESGIDIEVQPPGKKLQNMMLLSGGERAFTAIALLFAILKRRPAPFCLLDEIEAALDDANVHRFGEYIKKHTHLTQFLVITHRKGTMEASDCLYGVTMQEKGISSIVSMKLQ